MLSKAIAVVGSTTIDENIIEDRRRYKIGGVTTYAGITYRHHGLLTHIITNVAARDLQILERFRRESIKVYSGKTKHTTHFVNRIQRKERLQKIPLKASPIKKNQIAAAADRVGCFHLGPLHPADIETDCLGLLRNCGAQIVLDVQGYTRRVRNDCVYPGISKDLSTAFGLARIVKANGPELEAILDFYRFDLAELMHIFAIREFVVTRGESGGLIRDDRGNQVRYRAEPVASYEDPTGAGDVFFAAYVVARLFRRQKITAACQYAAKIAADQIGGKFIGRRLLELPPADSRFSGTTRAPKKSNEF